jgi:hypothetical protein
MNTDTAPQVDVTPVTVLYGHTTPETAYVVESYPYGSLRCQKRFWTETAAKGAKKGQQRMVGQTTNPKNDDRWNKPHPGQYAPMIFMYRDEKEHVHADHVSEYGIRPDEHARRVLRGIYGQLSDSDRRVYDVFVKISQKYAEPWEQWDGALRVIGGILRETGTAPTLKEYRDLRAKGEAPYLSNDAYAVAVAWIRRQAEQ